MDAMQNLVITVAIEYRGEITLNNDFTTTAPLELAWFPNNNLTIDARGKKFVFNADNTTAGQTYRLPASIFE